MNKVVGISVALCTFNGAEFLEDQLSSIANQTYPPAELVVCDDRSSDESVPLLKAFAKTVHFPVRIVVNASRLGSVQNFSYALSRCSGEYIALCDQDDVWHAEKLALLVEQFRDPTQLAVFSDAQLVSAEGAFLGCTLFNAVDLSTSDAAAIDRGAALEVLLRKTIVSGATLAIRTSFRETVLPIPHITRRSWDHDGWIALLAAAFDGLGLINAPLVMYRQHPSQQIGAQRRRIGAISRVRHAKAFRREGLTSIISDLVAVVERLKEVTDPRTPRLAPIRDKLDHLNRRREALDSCARIPLVARELYTGRYSRYGSGLSSAVGDLIL